MSLLEVLVVLSIMALIATLAAPRLLDNFGRAKSKAVEMQLANVKAALQIFYLDIGRYPTEAESLSALIAQPPGVTAWNGPYLDPDDIRDPWERQLIYKFPGPDGKKFGLISLGRDGQVGGTSEDRDISL